MMTPGRPWSAHWIPLAGLLAGLLAGCGQSARNAQLKSPYPLERARAAVGVAENGDPTAVQQLVQLLTDPDRAVRMYSILALERLTGETYGYHYYESEPQREAAVLRWRQALRDGEVRLRPRSLGLDRSPPPRSNASKVAESSPADGSLADAQRAPPPGGSAVDQQ